MKRITIFLVLVFCLAGLFAETGYRKHSWYSDKDSFSKSNQIIFEEVNYYTLPFKEALVYKTAIGNETTLLFYFFDYNTKELISAGYLINDHTTEQLKKDFQKKEKREVFYNSEDYEINKQDSQLKEDFYALMNLEFYSTELEKLSLQEQSEQKGDNKIIIYRYNEDTNCYVYEDLIPGQTAIIYIPHSQGY